MKRMFSRKILRVFTAIGALSFVVACGETTEPHGDDHAEPDGLIIRQGSTVLVEVLQQTVTGSLTVQEGQETTHLTVVFVDIDGDEITPDPSEFYMQVTVTDDAVAEFEQDTPGEFGGHFHGVAEGQTTLTFSLMHGQVGTGHPDYISPAITGTVTQ